MVFSLKEHHICDPATKRTIASEVASRLFCVGICSCRSCFEESIAGHYLMTCDDP